MTEPFTPDMNRLKSELGRTPPPALVKQSPEEYAPKKSRNATDEAHVAQSIKILLRGGPDWDRLTDNQKEMLDLIATQISRILAGRDFWRELSEYAEQGHEE